jgi:hypothetical protein
MFLESRARRRICCVVRGDIGQRDTAQFGGESRTQRHNVHSENPPLFLLHKSMAKRSARQRTHRQVRRHGTVPISMPSKRVTLSALADAAHTKANARAVAARNAFDPFGN